MTPRCFVTLSAVVTALRLDLAFKLAAKFGYDGVEVMPTRLTSVHSVVRAQKKYNTWATSVHGPFWTRKKVWNLLIHGDVSRKLEAIVFGCLLLGSFESNPARKIARSLGIPIVLHPGVIFELEHQRKLGLLKGLKVWVENDDLVGFGVEVAKRAYDLLEKAGIEVRLVCDIEHLAKEFWNECENFLDLLNRVIANTNGRRIAQFHICDLDPGAKDIKGGGHKRFGEGKLPIQEILSRVRALRPEARVVVEVSKESMYKKPWLSREDRGWAEETARESIATIRQI